MPLGWIVSNLLPASRKEALQGVCGDASVSELLCRTGGRGEAFDRVSVLFSTLTDDG
jgi:hypothetical protein